MHEAYIRLVDTENAQHWDSRGHFFAAAAEAMRRILLNRARDKGRQKRGRGRQRVDLDNLSVADQASEEELVAIDDALQHAHQKGIIHRDLKPSNVLVAQSEVTCILSAIERRPARRRPTVRFSNEPVIIL